MHTYAYKYRDINPAQTLQNPFPKRGQNEVRIMAHSYMYGIHNLSISSEKPVHNGGATKPSSQGCQTY